MNKKAARLKFVKTYTYDNKRPDFFDKRDALAVKINQELLDAHLLLWKRENVF